MLKKEIKYVDYNGTERTEPFYFNLNKAEVAEMELEVKGGLSEVIKRIVATDDRPQLIAIFKNLILKSYGVKSDDGKRFIKNQELRDEFEQSEAYVELFMKLASDEKEAAAFIEGIIPKVPEDHKSSELHTV